MKKRIGIIEFSIVLLMLVGVYAQLDFKSSFAKVTLSEYHDGIVDIWIDSVPLAASSFIIPVPTASGVNVKKNDKSEIDYSNAQNGYVMIKYIPKTSKALRVVITGPSGVAYTYVLKPGGEYEVFPITDGSGSYSIGVFEQIEGSKYATANSATVKVALKDDYAPFICPSQYVNFNKDSKTVLKAVDLVKDANKTNDKITAIYDYVVNNLKYDNELAANVKSGYIPDVDEVLKKGKGICFDYSAVMIAMLRSQGIPSKLVIGYAGTVYHAWINVYTDEAGWINKAIYFDGKSWKLMDPTFASTGGQSAEAMKFIGDGKNYTAKYYY